MCPSDLSRRYDPGRLWADRAVKDSPDAIVSSPADAQADPHADAKPHADSHAEFNTHLIRRAFAAHRRTHAYVPKWLHELGVDAKHSTETESRRFHSLGRIVRYRSDV